MRLFWSYVLKLPQDTYIKVTIWFIQNGLIEKSVAFKYHIQGFIHTTKLHELIWIREIKFVKCYSYIEISSKNAWIHEILNVSIQFMKNLWKYTSVETNPYTVVTTKVVSLATIFKTASVAAAGKVETYYQVSNASSYSLVYILLFNQWKLKFCL